MSRVVSPTRDQLKALRTPLTPGERQVFELFDSQLSDAWEIYVQPHLNGLRPDFVLLNPEVGIAVFEVKDWNLDLMDYRMEERGGGFKPRLVATKDGKTFSIENSNPVSQVHRYRQEVMDIYCPRLEQGAGFAAVTAGVVFPFASESEVRGLLAPSLRHRGMDRYPGYSPVTGAESLSAGNIEKVFPESCRRYSKLMSEDLAKDLRCWLVEPEFASAQRDPLPMDRQQIWLATTRTPSGFRRIKGPAGSGKSQVLAARAAQLEQDGKDVLVVAFNITLLNYLPDMASRWSYGEGAIRRSITYLNFHSWCRRVCLDAGYEDDYAELSRGVHGGNTPVAFDTWEEALLALVDRALESGVPGSVPCYDAVLVDEGQDFRPGWWNLLRRVCREGGEMLLAADATQDIYEKGSAWTDEAMIGAGFPGGPWVQMRFSYRLPVPLIRLTRTFVEWFLPGETSTLPEFTGAGLELEPCALRWIQVRPDQAVVSCRDALLSMPSSTDSDVISMSEITFLTNEVKNGMDVLKEIESRKIWTIHTFDTDKQESRRKKLAFYMGGGSIKLTTLHSFKGWEARALVVYTGASASHQSTLSLIYTGLTRLKRHPSGSYLTVVSCADELEEYGRLWPEFDDRRGAQLAVAA